ncbi:MAG: hypothetical protein Q7S61_02375 [bacterium]|nr:hypothetical protein [bacterium]
MGKGKVSEGGGSLTEADFEKIAKEWGMSVEDTKKNTYKLLQQEVGSKDKEK